MSCSMSKLWRWTSLSQDIQKQAARYDLCHCYHSFQHLAMCASKSAGGKTAWLAWRALVLSMFASLCMCIIYVVGNLDNKNYVPYVPLPPCEVHPDSLFPMLGISAPCFKCDFGIQTSAFDVFALVVDRLGTKESQLSMSKGGSC